MCTTVTFYWKQSGWIQSFTTPFPSEVLTGKVELFGEITMLGFVQLLTGKVLFAHRIHSREVSTNSHPVWKSVNVQAFIAVPCFLYRP